MAEGGGVNPETREGKTNPEKPVSNTSWESRRTVVQSLTNSNNHKGRDEWILQGLLQLAFFFSFHNSRGCFLSQSALSCRGSLLTDCTGPGMLNKYLWGEWLNDFNFGSSPSRHQQMFRESKLTYFPLDVYTLTDITNRMWRQGLEPMWLFIKIKAKWGGYRTLEVG